jgi:hypothetical protein
MRLAARTRGEVPERGTPMIVKVKPALEDDMRVLVDY